MEMHLERFRLHGSSPRRTLKRFFTKREVRLFREAVKH